MSGEKREQYCDFRPEECSIDEGLAGVTYDVAWSSKEFPGEVDCEIVLRDEEDDVVGREVFGLLVLDPTIVGRGGPVPVEVSAPPAEAAATCEPGGTEEGSGYAFEFVEVRQWEAPPSGDEEVRPRSELIFDVEFLVENPDARTCRVVVTLRDGSTWEGDERNVMMSDSDQPFTVTVPIADPASIEDADVLCRPYEGP